MKTARGATTSNMATCGIPTNRSKIPIGRPIAKAPGITLRRGVGPGLGMSPGALRLTTTGGGTTLVARGAGSPGHIMATQFMDRLLWASSVEELFLDSVSESGGSRWDLGSRFTRGSTPVAFL